MLDRGVARVIAADEARYRIAARIADTLGSLRLRAEAEVCRHLDATGRDLAGKRRVEIIDRAVGHRIAKHDRTATQARVIHEVAPDGLVLIADAAGLVTIGCEQQAWRFNAADRQE